MARKKSYKSLIAASVLLGIFISIQIKSINNGNDQMTTSKKGDQLASELKSLKDEEDSLKSNIKSLKDQIDRYRGNKEEGQNQIIKDEIKKYEKLIGYTEVKGKGITVKISPQTNLSESGNSNDISYNYDLLLSLINKLNSAQANAISINGQRIIHSTYIHTKDEGIYINEVPIKAPYIIKSIGDPDTLASALQIKYGIVWEIEKYYNSKVDIIKSDKTIVEAYNGKLK